jgi:hypothetical protein
MNTQSVFVSNPVTGANIIELSYETRAEAIREMVDIQNDGFRCELVTRSDANLFDVTGEIAREEEADWEFEV